MDRKKFIKRFSKGALATALGASVISSESHPRQVGFNHIPKKEDNSMNTVLHKADTRGTANLGWLNSRHTFSFSNYFNPERMHFGKLRVLNDDTVAPGMGFGTHPHDNMEIISIPLKGDLEHQDSMGNAAVIREGEIQVMSAGTGVTHSEYNKNKDKEVKFLQIWVFPREKDVTPRYDQIEIKDLERPNEFSQVLSPVEQDQGVWINQDAWFSIGKFEEATETTYKLHHESNGVYAFVLDGDAAIEGQELNTRDGFGVWNTQEIKVNAKPGSRILLMEVPMN